MSNRMIVVAIAAIPALVLAVFAWRWGEELWYGRYPVTDGYDAFWSADHERAHPILRAYARQGDPRAQLYLAMQYVGGKGTFRSQWLGARWMHKAAVQEYPDALVMMGQYLLSGIGTDQDVYKAQAYFRKAAVLGHPEGTAGLAEIALFEHRNEESGLALLRTALAQGSVRGRAIECHWAAPELYGPWQRTADPALLKACVTAGLDGFEGSLSRAASLLHSDDSPLRDVERAYELAIVGLTWWPDQWEDPNHGLSVAARASVLTTPPLPDLTSWDDRPGDRQAPDMANYWSAVDTLNQRIRAIGEDPTGKLDPPDFGPGVRLDLEPAAMLRAEAAARAYLIENPRSTRPGLWIQ